MFHVGQVVLIPHPESPDDELDIRGTVLAVHAFTDRLFEVQVLHEDGTEDILILSKHDMKAEN